MLIFPFCLFTFLLCLKLPPFPASNPPYAGVQSQSCVSQLPACASCALSTWIPSENPVITDNQPVTSPLLMLPRHIVCQSASRLGPSVFPLVAKRLFCCFVLFLTWIAQRCSFGLSTVYGWVLQVSCCPGWQWSTWGWWEVLKLALPLLQIHFAVTLSVTLCIELSTATNNWAVRSFFFCPCFFGIALYRLWNMHEKPRTILCMFLEYGEYLPVIVNNNGKSTKAAQKIQHCRNAAICSVVILLPLSVAPNTVQVGRVPGQV